MVNYAYVLIGLLVVGIIFAVIFSRRREAPKEAQKEIPLPPKPEVKEVLSNVDKIDIFELSEPKIKKIEKTILTKEEKIVLTKDIVKEKINELDKNRDQLYALLQKHSKEQKSVKAAIEEHVVKLKSKYKEVTDDVDKTERMIKLIETEKQTEKTVNYQS